MPDFSERPVTQRLVDQLIRAGYPADGIVPQWPVGSARVDIAIMEPESEWPIAVFEIHKGFDERLWDHKLTTQLLAIKKAISLQSVSAIVVGFTTENQELIFYAVSGDWLADKTNELYITRLPDLPAYQVLKMRRQKEDVAIAKKNGKEAVNWLNYICLFLAPFALVLFYLDYEHIHEFTASQLTLLGVFLSLMIIPFAAKLKFFGVEFERYKDEK